MDPISVAAAIGLASAALLGYALTRRAREQEARRRHELWQAAARAAGLTSIVASEQGLAGRSALLHVQLSRFSGAEVNGTRIEIWGPGLPDDLRVERGAAGQKDVEIGDQGFDDGVWVTGSAAMARALLEPATRQVLRALTEGRLERSGRAPFWATGRLARGVLRVDVADVATWRYAPLSNASYTGDDYVAQRPDGYAYFGGSLLLPEALELVLALARRLEPARDVPRRLVENLSREPEPRARLLLLDTLLEQYPHHAATREALHAALSDPDARLRLRAGSLVGPEGRQVLFDLAGGEGADDDVNAKAVEALGSEIYSEELRGVLKHALLVRKKATAAACLAALGRAGDGEAIATLAKVLAVERGELAAKAAAALGASGKPAAEGPLLAALGESVPGTRVAAARALGEVGSAAAVPALKEVEAEENGELRHAARQSIAAIRARLTGAKPGQLSLAAGERGQLTISEDAEAGRLSLAAPTKPVPRR